MGVSCAFCQYDYTTKTCQSVMGTKPMGECILPFAVNAPCKSNVWTILGSIQVHLTRGNCLVGCRFICRLKVPACTSEHRFKHRSLLQLQKELRCRYFLWLINRIHVKCYVLHWSQHRNGFERIEFYRITHWAILKLWFLDAEYRLQVPWWLHQQLVGHVREYVFRQCTQLHD